MADAVASMPRHRRVRNTGRKSPTRSRKSSAHPATKPDDENAGLSGFANPKMADAIDAQIEDGFENARRERRGPRTS